MKLKVQGAEADVASGLGVNEVIVGGRVSGAPEERQLPSGDTVVLLRLVVPRSGPAPERDEVVQAWTPSMSLAGQNHCSARRFVSSQVTS